MRISFQDLEVYVHSRRTMYHNMHLCAGGIKQSPNRYAGYCCLKLVKASRSIMDECDIHFHPIVMLWWCRIIISLDVNYYFFTTIFSYYLLVLCSQLFFLQSLLLFYHYLGGLCLWRLIFEVLHCIMPMWLSWIIIMLLEARHANVTQNPSRQPVRQPSSN